MGTKIKNLGIKREYGHKIVYFFKEDKDGFLCLWQTKLLKDNKERKMLIKTDIKKDGNLLSWYYVKTADDKTLDMYRTNRNFVPPGTSWGKAKKTLEVEKKKKSYKSMNLKMTDGILDATLKIETKDGFVESKIGEEDIKNENNK